MKHLRIFLDSDVVISSILSLHGAAHALLSSPARITRCISVYSLKEIEIVLERMQVESQKLLPVKESVEIVSISEPILKIKKDYIKFVNDENDAHIVAGAVKAKVAFLITYNLKDFRKNSIRHEFSIQVITPGMFLQYLRSIQER